MRVYRDVVRTKSNRRVYREWVARPGVSAVVPVLGDQILLVRQFRYGVNRRLWEVPAGTFNKGESPVGCARRECEEETGYRPAELASLGSYFSGPAHTDETVYMYAAAKLTKSRAHPEEDEEITLGYFSKGRGKKMLKSGRIRDAKSIIALTRYFAHD